MPFLLWFAIRTVTVLAFSIFAHAIYFIDDANATILYTGATWSHFSKANPEYNWTDTPSVYYNTVYVTTVPSKTKVLITFTLQNSYGGWFFFHFDLLTLFPQKTVSVVRLITAMSR